ncbi:MAG: EamA family transporter [Clostridiales bacterium]|nr:EamA family transporter [Clostridiales bacterium]
MHLSGPVYLILAIAASAAMTLVLKAFKTEGTNRYAIILGNYVTCIIIGFLILADKTSVLQIDPETLLFGALGGVLFVVSLVLLQRSIEVNGAILTSAFSRMGLVVPLIVSIAFLGEKPRLIQFAGMLIVLIAICIINGKKDQRLDGISPILLICVLLAGGFSDCMAKIFNYFGMQTQNDLYILMVFFTAGVLTFILLLTEYKKTGKFGGIKDFVAGIAVGIPNYFSASLLLKALADVPAFIAYTVFSTGVLLLITAISLILFKERLKKTQAIGIGLILIALVLLNI